jgi:pimeloyl-ACP methyl ester carboxylesterase
MRATLVAAEPFEVVVGGGVLRGHRDGTGPPALLLHGGPALPDYTGGCAASLDGLFSTIRYTQRGTPPSDDWPPYTVESHAADAIAVLDAFGLDRAWAIGHSWGGHLALHIAVTHPDRVVGLLLVDTLGADGGVFPEFDANLRRGLTDAERARVDDIEARRRAGAVTEAELVERLGILWPRYFGQPEKAPPSPFGAVGAQASTDTNRSIAEHFAARTLTRGLPTVAIPALFVHGEDDPLPVRSSESAAALIRGARLETIPDCGHFPWLEQPAAFRETVESLLADTAR